MNCGGIVVGYRVAGTDPIHRFGNDLVQDRGAIKATTLFSRGYPHLKTQSGQPKS